MTVGWCVAMSLLFGALLGLECLVWYYDRSVWNGACVIDKAGRDDVNVILLLRCSGRGGKNTKIYTKTPDVVVAYANGNHPSYIKCSITPSGEGDCTIPKTGQ